MGALPERDRRALVRAAAEELGRRLGGGVTAGEIEAFLRGCSRSQLQALMNRGRELVRHEQPPPPTIADRLVTLTILVLARLAGRLLRWRSTSSP